MESIEERFWSKVDKRGPDECWLWRGAREGAGYGHLRCGGKPRKAHRVSWELHNGEIPKGVGFHGTCVLHRCDNPPCVNPAHLFLGTHAENCTDKKVKGRAQRMYGAANGRAKVTESDVSAIRTTYAAGLASRSALGRKYGLTHRMVSLIVQGKAWTGLGAKPC